MKNHVASKAPEGREFYRVHTRKLDRGVAHARMKKADMRRVNQHDYVTRRSLTGMIVQERMGSYFSKHWREVADEDLKNM